MRTQTTARWMLVLVGACLAPACGEGTPAEPDFLIGASGFWSWTAARPDALGYQVALVLEQRANGDACREASASTRLTVDGVAVPLVRDPQTHCLKAQFVSQPVLTDLVVTARVEEEGQLVGEVVFEGLTPGTAATLISAPDGRVHAGDDLLIVPPPKLPTSYTSRAVYYPLDDGAWRPDGIDVGRDIVRRLDGLHLTAPAITGPAVLIIEGGPPYIPPDVACPGFASCTEIIEVTLGPFLLTGLP